MTYQNLNGPEDQAEKPKRPLYLTGTALSLIAIGLWYLIVMSLFVFLPTFYHYLHSSPLIPMLIGVGTLVSLTLIVSGIGVMRGASWSRPLAIVGISFLFIKWAFPVLFSHRPFLSSHWVEIAFYLFISSLLFSRRASAFFGARREKA